MTRTFDSSPGGFFDDVNQTPGTTSAATSADEALNWARDSRGWAVGDTETPIGGWTTTNNSKYWAGVAAMITNGLDSEQIWAAVRRAEAAAVAAGMDSDEAAVSATAAAASATAAANSVTEADSDARAAERARDQAQTLANNAATSALDARGYALEADSEAANARISAQDANRDAGLANTAATNAQNSANAADGYATNAANSATAAAGSATAAATSATNAATSATNAATSASDAKGSDDRAHASAVRARSWAVGPAGDTDSSGTATNNAHYWAQQAESHAGSITVRDSEITITAGTNMVGGGSFTLNGFDTDITIGMGTDNIVNAAVNGTTLTLTKNDGTTLDFTGGGGTPLPNPNLSLSLNHTEFPLTMTGSTTRTITATLTPNAGFTASAQNVSATDQSGSAITVTGSGNTWTFTININTPGQIRVAAHATLTRTSDSMVFTNQNAHGQTIDVDEEWYGGLLTAAPTDLANFPAGSNLGVYTNNDSHEFTADGSADHQLYLALPTRTGGYTFKSGELFLSRVDTGLVIDSFWTWYRIRDFDNTHNGGTMTITVEEA